VASLHNASVHLRHYKPYRTWLETRILDRYSRRIIACSYTVARVQQPRFNRKKLVVISNPVPDMTTVPADQVQALREEFLPEGEGILMISVGRLIPEKGYSDLIRVVKLVKEQCAFPVRLLIAGKGYLMDSLRTEATKAGNEDDIIFLGERNDIPVLLAASDIYAGALRITRANPWRYWKRCKAGFRSWLPMWATTAGGGKKLRLRAARRRRSRAADNIVYLAQHPQERSRMGENAARYVKAITRRKCGWTTCWICMMRCCMADAGRLRVAMIIQSYLPRLGGAEKQLAAVCSRLREKGIESVVITPLCRFTGLRSDRTNAGLSGAGSTAQSVGGVVLRPVWAEEDQTGRSSDRAHTRAAFPNGYGHPCQAAVEKTAGSESPARGQAGRPG
jgi:hypothetical protein